MFSQAKTFIKSNKNWIAIGLILLLAAFMRLYRISDYMTFLGDEGRDVLVAKHILEGHLTFLGPRASAGDFYLGPVYYYFMAPFLLLFHFDPVGPAVMIALSGIVTVFLLYYITKKLIGTAAGLFAAALYAVSPLVLAYSRSSWNPNLMPLVTVLLLYLLYRGVRSPSWKKFVGTGILFGIALQLHYIEVFVGIIIVVFVLLGRLLLERKVKIASLLRYYCHILLGFIIGISPFLAFEIKNHFPNTKTIFTFIFSSAAGTSSATHAPFLSIISDVFFRLFGRLLLRFPPPEQFHLVDHTVLSLWSLLVLITAILCVLSLLKVKDKLFALLLFLWLFFGVVLFGFYHKSIYDYYFEFMFPLPFLLLGNLLSLPWQTKKKKLLKVVSIVVFAGFFIFNLYGMPFRFEPNRQKAQAETIAKFVISKTSDKPFNFALLTPGNSDHAYRYYFEILGHKPVTIENPIIDPKRTSVTDQLLIVCEDIHCKPLGNPLFEVAGFGRAEIAGEWNVSVVKVYRLVHYQGK